MKRRFFLSSGLLAILPKISMASVISPTRSLLIQDIHTGDIIQSSHSKSLIYPASITKLMTLEIAFKCLEKGILNLNENLKMTEYSSKKAPTHLGLRIGETIPLHEALKAITVHSCNDIASLVAERISGSEYDFVSLMNERADEFKMRDTIFYNSTGLPDKHNNVSTANDIAILANNILYKHKEYLSLFNIPEWSWNGKTYHNSNRLMGKCPGMDFCKTGYIHASGFNIVFSINQDHRKFLCVLTGCQTSLERDRIIEYLVQNIF